MDISAYLPIATAILGVISSIITQVSKQHIPDEWRKLFALGVSVLVAVAAVFIGNLYHDGMDATSLIFGVIGVAQAIYAAVDKLVEVTKAANQEQS